MAFAIVRTAALAASMALFVDVLVSDQTAYAPAIIGVLVTAALMINESLRLPCGP